MVFGSGVVGLSVLTHMHTPPLLTSLTQEIPLPPMILSVSPHAQALGGFGSHADIFLAPRVAEHPRITI